MSELEYILDFKTYKEEGKIKKINLKDLQDKLEKDSIKKDLDSLDNIAIAMEMSTDELVNYLLLKKNLEKPIRHIPIDIIINELTHRIIRIDKVIQETLKENENINIF